MLEKLAQKAREHYAWMEELYVIRRAEGNPLTPLLDAYDKAHPGMDVWQLKAAQYRILAENIDTVVFDETPLYFVNNMCFRDGMPYWSAAGWLQRRNEHLFRDADPETFDTFQKQIEHRVHLCCGPYADIQHFCYPVAHVVQWGLKGAYERVQKAKEGADESGLRFLECAEAGLLAAKRIAQRFAETAKARRKALSDPALLCNMDRLIAAAEHAPWEPATSFLEGLNTMWFCRDVLGVMDGIGNSHLGRPDFMLNDLLCQDIEKGVLTQEEAQELVCQFILLGDMHYDKNKPVQGDLDHEMEMGIVLGGCDSDGRPVFNEVTRMFLRAHREMKVVYPKLHCRIGSNSPKEYLQEIAADFAAGRSVLGLSNDDSYIPALVRDGLKLEDARNYANTGCWSAIAEGCESVPGGNYFYLITMLEQSVYGPEQEFIAANVICESFYKAQNFEELYRIYIQNVLQVMVWRNEVIGKYGPIASRVNPLPLASVFISGCLESRKDFTQGGCRYNRNTIDPSGFANAVDALLAMKKLCFDVPKISLRDYLGAVRSNWEGHEELLYEVRHCPHFGDQSADSMDLSQRLHYDLYEGTRGQRNERGGSYSLNYIGYREFLLMAEKVRATPDGRRNGDMFALGIGPTRYHPADALTATTQSVGALNSERVNVSSLDLQLPLGQMDIPKLSMLLEALTHTGVKHLQINVVSLEDLRDAQKHPERHQDLVVRVCGFSAKFVSLSLKFQEEFISRSL